eukprot:6024080-Alexandrium_andersonii.AAC.1
MRQAPEWRDAGGLHCAPRPPLRAPAYGAHARPPRLHEGGQQQRDAACADERPPFEGPAAGERR